jgi:aquaporin Z
MDPGRVTFEEVLHCANGIGHHRTHVALETYCQHGCHFFSTSESHCTDSMSSPDHSLPADAPNSKVKPRPALTAAYLRPELSASDSLRSHWPEYLMEAGLLGAFMVSACVFGALYEFPRSPVHQAVMSGFLRRALMGISMGLTAIAIIYSPWGKQSGAHINPSVTFTFFRLGKINGWDTLFYITAQFVGAALGVFLVAFFLGKELADPAVRYVVTVPGPKGAWVALLSEFTIAFGLMTTVLYFSNHHRLDRYTGLFAGFLVATYIALEAPFSGMSMNPARTFGSAIPPMVWDGLWVYLTAPPLGMLTAAEIYLWWKGKQGVKCCKLHHNSDKRCIFCGANGGFAA